MKVSYFDKSSWSAMAKSLGFTVICDPCHKGNATAYQGTKVRGSWSVNKGEGYLIERY